MLPIKCISIRKAVLQGLKLLLIISEHIVTESACNEGDLGSIPGKYRENPCRREQLPTPVFLPGKFHGQRNLVGYSSWDCKELDTIV